MERFNQTANQLINETSPYLLQHAYNPVNWYPWGAEAFEKAKKEEKTIFLSIGYSTCHWCHVMAEESFEDKEVAKLLNENFISIKVDREERPDIDSVYMAVCQTMTGSGGWPMTIFMTPEQKPFFAGTYFPKTSTKGMAGFLEISRAIADAWKQKRNNLTEAAEKILEDLRLLETEQDKTAAKEIYSQGKMLIERGVSQLKRVFDSEHGGFGTELKFPSGHNLLFLMDYYERSKDKEALQIVEKTLVQMYKGGLFDHIGGGFSRYSTDKYFLVPHFEKMLYDNALLMICYCKAYEITKKKLYRDVAERTASYILQEMTSENGGFYASQDADSQGEEGRFYTFSYDEIAGLLGPEDGTYFNSHYGATEGGNFEGKNIFNLLIHEEPQEIGAELLDKVYQYRKSRYKLHTDDKILTAWNGIMIAAFSKLAEVLKEKKYLKEALASLRFILGRVKAPSDLFVSYRSGIVKGEGLLDDYAYFIYSLITLYETTGEKDYLNKAQRFTDKALENFFDEENGGFYLWGRTNEKLVIQQKEVYDGAMPSGNSVMAYNLTKLSHYTRSERLYEASKKQMEYMCGVSQAYPAGHSFFLLGLSLYLNSEDFYTCKDGVCSPYINWSRGSDEEARI